MSKTGCLGCWKILQTRSNTRVFASNCLGGRKYANFVYASHSSNYIIIPYQRHFKSSHIARQEHCVWPAKDMLFRGKKHAIEDQSQCYWPNKGIRKWFLKLKLAGFSLKYKFWNDQKYWQNRSSFTPIFGGCPTPFFWLFQLKEPSTVHVRSAPCYQAPHLSRSASASPPRAMAASGTSP